MTVNEARIRHGLEKLPDGDQILVPFNMIPLGSDSKLSSLPEDEKRIKSTKEIEHPLRDESVRKKYGETKAKREDKQIDTFETQVVRYFDDQKKRLIEAIDNRKSFKKKDLLSETFSIGIESKLGKATFLPLLTDLLIEAGGEAMTLAGSAYSFNVTAEITSWMDNRADVFMNSVTETTYKKLSSEFAESFNNGESRRELISRIEDVYDNQITKGRAATIARTEVHNANQYGTMQGYKQGNLPIKIWVSVIDSETRGNDPDDLANHLTLDGEERPVDMPFSNGLMYPGDPQGSASETINCRCQI